MKLEFCGIRDFRNISSSDIYFTNGVNLIKGDNAEGKTSVLEAVYVFARGRSFRTNKEAEIIKFGADKAKLDIEYADSRRKNKMSVSYFREEKRKLYKNGVNIRKTSEFIGNFRAILFTPDHLSLIKSAASDRRLFMDIALSQITPNYINYMRSYSILLGERNALLKDKNAEGKDASILFEVLGEEMAKEAAAITVLRSKYCEKLSSAVGGYFEKMTGGKEKTNVRYESCISEDKEELKDKKRVTELYYKKFTENKERELYFRTSLYGPQKDDIDIELNGYSSRRFCSQGQQRSLAIAMKLSEGDISAEVTGEYPVYLLDDISGELDEKRNGFFMSQLKDRQIIITSCSVSDTKGFDNVITMKNGEAVF